MINDCWGSRLLVSCALPLLIVLSFASFRALGGDQGCAYKGHSSPQAVSKNIGQNNEDAYYFTTYSDVEKADDLYEYVRGVHNRSPRYLLPFVWEEVGFSYKELGTASCTFNSFTSSFGEFREDLSTLVYGPTGKEHADVPLYASKSELEEVFGPKNGRRTKASNDRGERGPYNPLDGTSKVSNLPGQDPPEAPKRTPPLYSKFDASGPDGAQILDLRLTSAIEGRSIVYTFRNASKRPVMVAIPSLSGSIEAVQAKNQGSVEYRVERAGKEGERKYLIPAESFESQNRIMIRFEGPLATSERLVRASISDPDGRAIGTCKLSLYLPVVRD